MKHLLKLVIAAFASINIGLAAVDINTAGEVDLQKVPGIGPAMSKRIVEDRAKNGPYKSIEDLKRVKGIGDKKFEKMKAEVTISGGGSASAGAPGGTNKPTAGGAPSK